MKTGIIKFVNRDRMFGFIAPDSGGPDVYMRLGDVTPELIPLLEAGSSVTYVEQQKYEKTYAVEVKVATTPESQRVEKRVALSVVPELVKFA